MTELEKFCETYDIKYFTKLDKHVQEFFLLVSEYILNKKEEKGHFRGGATRNSAGFLGLAQIIVNMMKPKPYKHINEIFTLWNMKVLESTKYDKKIVLLGDVHTYDHSCSMDSIDVATFIKNQVETATSFVDLYLEIPYIFNQRYKGRGIGNTFMLDTQKKFENCFTWVKKYCPYYNLRAHYVDLREPILGEIVKLQRDINELFFMIQYTNGTDSRIPRRVDQILAENEKYGEVCATREKLVSHMYNIVDKSKIRKQINYVEEVDVYNKLNSLLDDVLKVDNTNFNEKYNWCRIMMMLRDIKSNPTDRRSLDRIYKLYVDLSEYTGYLMDIYVLARMFRKYRYVENNNSLPAKSIIVYTGANHTKFYANILRQLDFSQIFNRDRSWEKDQFGNVVQYNCIDVSELEQPLFGVPR